MFMEEANQRIQFHLLVQDYIEKHNCPEIALDLVKGEILDEDYKEKSVTKKYLIIFAV